MRLLIGMVNLAEMLSGWLIGKRNGGEYFFMNNCPDCVGTGKHRSENDTYFYQCASCSGSGTQGG